MKKITTFIKKHKKSLIALAIILGLGGWYLHSRATTSAAVTYVTRPVTLGTIRSTVSGTGQVSSANQLTINPKVSGTVTSVNVKNGDTVTAGQVLVTLDSTTAAFSLRSAQIALQRLQSTSPVTVSSNLDTVNGAQSSLGQAYSSSFNTLTNSYNDINPIISNLSDMFYSRDTSPYLYDSTAISQHFGDSLFQNKMTAGQLLDKVKKNYSDFRTVYIATSQDSTSTMESTLTQELSIAEDLVQTIKDTSVVVNYIVSNTLKGDRTSAMTTDQNNLTTWLATANSAVNNISSAISSIDSNYRSLNQAVTTLDQTQSTTNPLDLQSAELSLEQAQYSYDQYTIRAPFAGIVGNVTVNKNDTVSGSTVIATLVSKSFVSHISLNEVDAAKVTVGQPVTVTFNAIPNVTATGTVTNVDSVGTVSQGVVSYNVVISFNTDNPEVKSGMSLNATIVTSEKDNVIVVPNSALKSAGNFQYVQIPATAASASGAQTSQTSQTGQATRTARATTQVSQVTRKNVQTGVSDDINTEITSGLNVGDIIVTRTITSTTGTAASTNILSSLTGRGATGGTGGGGFGGGARPAGGATAAGAGGAGAAAGR